MPLIMDMLSCSGSPPFIMKKWEQSWEERFIHSTVKITVEYTRLNQYHTRSEVG